MLKPPVESRALQILTWCARCYLVSLLGALVARFVFQDATPSLFALNSLLFYAFTPLLPAALVAGFARRQDLYAGCALGVAVGLWLWAPLFWAAAPPANPVGSLRVMTYNLLGYNFETSSVVAIIRASDADLVALQELNPENARAIEAQLADAYPYRLLDPQPGVTGSGILSRRPFTRLPAPGGAGWVGTPKVIELELGTRKLRFVQFHAASGPDQVQVREQQAELLAAYAEGVKGPVVLAGDLNATDQNRAYARLTRELGDAWRGAGGGLGHTFPGEPTAETGGSRPTILGFAVPKWLIRIDFVFHSNDFVATSAELSSEPGFSDHRPFVVTLERRR